MLGLSLFGCSDDGTADATTTLTTETNGDGDGDGDGDPGDGDGDGDGDVGCSYSAYVSDHCANSINFCWQ